MNKKFIILGIIALIIIFISGFFVYQKYNKGDNQNIDNQYNTKQYVIASSDEGFNAKFIEYQNKLEEAVKSFNEGGDKPNVDFFIEKARYAQYLGHNDWAKEILNDIFTYYDNSSVGWNNLAKIYEEEKDYIKANEYYQKMIDTFGEKDYWSFYYYICSNLMNMNDKVKTQECYDKYKKLGGNDSQIEEYLK
jgi:tetratricopeptide (TPR) repeat protein